jgi:hypothetical protein
MFGVWMRMDLLAWLIADSQAEFWGVLTLLWFGAWEC